MLKDRTDLLQEIKGSKTIKDAYIRSIEIDNDHCLLPICKAHRSNAQLIALLTKWRNQFVNVYPTQFVATEASTLNWLENKLLADTQKILFLVVGFDGEIFGHIGLANVNNERESVEIDNVIKGNESAKKGLFGQALNKLIDWALEVLLIEDVELKVFNDNYHAIKFYAKNQFFLKEQIPLKKNTFNEFTNYIPNYEIDDPDKFFNLMVHKKVFNKKDNKLILTAGPSISQLESYYAFDAAKNGWNENWSFYLNKLEEEFADYIGVKYALATSSCTGALHIALMSLGIGEGDEVIVPDQTWVATANAVKYTGATPVFADIEVDSWNIAPNKIKEIVTSRTKAIIPVHMYGNPANMREVIKVANEMSLFVIEDAAPSIGAEFDGRKTGSFGDFGAFSFQGAKLMVTGEGGMLVTNNTDLYEKAKKIWDQGRNSKISRPFWIDENGLKYKMSNIQASIGLGQLRRVDLLIKSKRRIFQAYQNLLGDLDCLDFIKEYQGAKSICWMSSFRINEKSPIDRDNLIKQLREHGIDSRPVFPAISQYPIWGNNSEPRVNSLLVGNTGINLPSGVCLKKHEIQYIADTIRKILS